MKITYTIMNNDEEMKVRRNFEQTETGRFTIDDFKKVKISIDQVFKLMKKEKTGEEV